MRKALLMIVVMISAACAKQGPPGATRSEAAAVAGEWSVFAHDTKVNAWHAKLEAKGSDVVASKIYDQDADMGAQQHKRGDTEKWATFGIAGGKLSGTLAGAAAGAAPEKLEGTVHDNGQGVSLHSGKGDWELRRR